MSQVTVGIKNTQFFTYIYWTPIPANATRGVIRSHNGFSFSVGSVGMLEPTGSLLGEQGDRIRRTIIHKNTKFDFLTCL